MKSLFKFFPLLVLVFLFFVSCDFLDIPEESDLPIQEWEVDRLEYHRNVQRIFIFFNGSTGDISKYDYYKDFDRTIPLYLSSVMTIPGVVFGFGVGGGFTSNSVEFDVESGPEITKSTVATFYNEWFYLAEESDGDLFTSREDVEAKVRIVTKTMGITIVE